ncbi:putative lipid II flippase FtsW [Cnuibacter physcomitrellae]|uniref:Probable peptidoglycan glycosyltransferase FtsW n=1 Tax=Cnuibacter physcomitrellae TaxID=1619308 RepID=A0A1X9LNS7_9MICO|nr:putative lipid II flippase FtsW [Cnuibacter physcomitrellae]
MLAVVTTPLPDADRPSRAAVAPRIVRVLLAPLPRRLSADAAVLLAVVLFLVMFGLVMVLSASSVDSRIDSGDSFTVFLRQASFAAVGVPLMLLAARMPATLWARLSGPVLLVGCALQLLALVTPLGVTVNGNRNWLELGPLTFQPSEIVKAGIVLWLAMFLAQRERRLGEMRGAVLPTLLVPGAAIGLVLLGGDLGTAMILLAVVVGALYFAGVRMRHLLLVVGVIAVAVVIAAISRPSRLARIGAFLDPASADPGDDGYQTLNGYYALSDGGVFGAGIGGSKEKWAWLPAVDTDFIFAIVGDDLGFIGACTVLALLIVLAIVFARMTRGAQTMHQRVLTGAVMTWILGESLVNIAVVLGLFPVLGVPLPFVSAGGTALLSALVMVGAVVSVSRPGRSSPVR